MKKCKILLIALILIGVTVASTLLCACNNDWNEQPSGDNVAKDYQVKFYDTNGFISSLRNYATIIKSYEELKDFCNEETSPIFKNENQYIAQENQKIIELFQGYDKQFFKNKSLVAIFRIRPCLGLKTDIKDYAITENSLDITISIKIKADANYPDAMTAHIYLLELDKAKLSNIAQVNVEEIQEIIE